MKRVSKKHIKKQKTPQLLENKQDKSSLVVANIKYLFLLLIFFYIGVHLYNELKETEVLLKLQKILFIPTIIIGIISVYFDRNKLYEIISKQFSSEKEEQTNKVLDKLKDLFSKKEIMTIGLFIIILGIATFTLFHKLDYFDIFSDEVQVTQAAAGYYHTGEYKLWDFIAEKTIGPSENRGKPHQFVVAQSFKLFGVNTWAARFPSAFFGLLLIIFLFFIGRFFVKDKWAALLIILSFSMYYEFLFLGRWARMYGMVFPFFLLAFYCLYKFLEGGCRLKFIKSEKNKFFYKYFNFKYFILPFLLLLLYFNLEVHKNTALIFPVFLVFSIASIFVFPKEKKYITASIVAVLILILQILSPFKEGFSRFTFFQIKHSDLYANFLFAFPFSKYLDIVFLAILFPFLFFVKNSEFKKKFLYLYVLSIITFILFGSVFDFSPSYRYVSFATPITVLLIIGNFTIISKTLFNKYIQILLAVLLITSVGLHFKNNYKKLYEENAFSPAKPSIAHKLIRENFKKGDVIFRHYGPKIYLKGIDKNTKFYELGGKKGKDVYSLLNEMKKHKSGWLTWHSHLENNLDKNFVAYVNYYLKKYSGLGIDSSGEEVFYYNVEMLKPFKQFLAERQIPTANLSLGMPYSLVFDLEINNNTNGKAIDFLKDSISIGNYSVSDNKILFNIYKDTLSCKLQDKKQNIIISFNANKAMIFVEGKLCSEKLISVKKEYIKFKINPLFNGDIDNIRLYNFILSNEQINEIIKDKTVKEELSVDNKIFRTLYLWKKK